MQNGARHFEQPSEQHNLRERDNWGEPDVDGRIILRRIFRKWEGIVGTEWSWLRIGTGGGHLEVG
jgi:hypothetical protein